MPDNLFLSIDCATEECSVALGSGHKCIAEKAAERPMSHTSVLTLLIDELIKESGIHKTDLAAIICNMGPGSYTGLRVGLSTAKALCYGLEIPLLGISALEGIAHLTPEYLSEETFDAIIPMIDARRMEVYYAVFDNSLDRLLKDTNLIADNEALENFQDKFGRCVFVGPGPGKLKQLKASSDKQIIVFPSRARGFLPPGLKLWNAGSFADLAYSEPNYLKPPNITIPRKTLF